MARSSIIPNLLYGTLGLAALGAATYIFLRRRAARAEAAPAEDNPDTMLEVRRASRKAGRAAKQTAVDVGKDLKKGAADTVEAIADGVVATDPLNRF